MLPIPPIAYAAYAATQSLRQSEEKTEQAHRAQEQEKDSAHNADRYEHSVESSDEVQPIHDEPHQDASKQKKRNRKCAGQASDDDQQEHLDLTA